MDIEGFGIPVYVEFPQLRYPGSKFLRPGSEKTKTTASREANMLHLFFAF